ncbi:MAG: thiamine diphosphokinase [Anaerolineae bacterium]|nr:thiamine diphosphokinase [Anaerolineae bacterium]
MTRRMVIFANGELHPGPFVDRVLAEAASPDVPLIAADGGLRHVEVLGLTAHAVIGDMDSVDEETLARHAARGAAILRYPSQKDETDLELALRYAAEQGADWLRIIGGMGGRLDQTLANVLLLILPLCDGRDVRLVAGGQAAWIMQPGEHVLHGAVEDTLSLIPLGGDAAGVSTGGLRYPLRDETLRFGAARGISNVFVEPVATVRLRAGVLLAVHTLGRA